MLQALDLQRWDVFDQYVISDCEGLRPIGEPCRQIDLSNEDQHASMLGDWLSVDSIEKVSDWLTLYGMPDSEYTEDVFDTSSNTAYGYLALARKWRAWRDIIKWASDDNAKLFDSVCVWGKLEDLLVAGNPFTRTNQEHLVKTGRENFDKIRSGVRPWKGSGIVSGFVVDGSVKGTVDKDGSRAVQSDIWAELVFDNHGGPHVTEALIHHENDGVDYWQVEGATGQSLDDWMNHWRFELRKSALRLGGKWLNRLLKGMQPAVILEEDDDLRLTASWKVRDPISAMALALYKDVTQASLLEVCPHPSCGRLFRKTRIDKVSCGEERCKKWITRRNKGTGRGK